MDNIIIKTERLVLRKQQESDLDFLIKLWTDPDVTKYTGGPRQKEKLTESFYKIQENGENHYDLWYVTLPEKNEPIGMAGILEKEIENCKYFEVNFFFIKDYWNKGYATEISNEIIKYHLIYIHCVRRL